ncbi:MAG TPA: hypothetical protein VLK35_14870 [Methylomirabilota bacterium]|nr:hypothetical protein [Methylomirabilota bacterium]
MTRRGRGSVVVGLALLVQGCAGLIAGKESADVSAPAPAARPAPGRGTVHVEKGRPGFVIGAPHGTSDAATDVLGRELAKLTGFGLVVVTGYANIDGEGRRYNVNRPTESVPGAAARLEVETAPARDVYQAYRRHVTEAAQGALRFYVEVHGNSRAESAGRVEIATVGVSRETAWRLKTLLELIRDSRLPAEGDVPRLEVWVESQDPVLYTAAAAKQSGVLAQAPLALHIELPRAARTTHREAYTTVLADFLIQSAALLLPPPR